MTIVFEGRPEVTTVAPRGITLPVLLTAEQAISHHDPDQADGSNVSLFNREKRLLPGDSRPQSLPTQEQVDRICGEHPVPTEIAEFLPEAVNFEGFVATALVRAWLRIHGRGNQGLWDGERRYERLQERIRHAATQATTLTAWWARLLDGMGTPVTAQDADLKLLRLLCLPAGFQSLVLETLASEAQALVMLARTWNDIDKLQSEKYAKAAGKERDETGTVALSFSAASIARVGNGYVMQVPHVQANSLRNRLCRNAGRIHLEQQLGLLRSFPGRGFAPPGVDGLFASGGNIAAGAAPPSNAFHLARQTRHLWPLLDLLGGVVDSFDLGESRLKLGCQLVCRENAPALAETPFSSLSSLSDSAFDYLDTHTHVRSAHDAAWGDPLLAGGDKERGAMLTTYEALASGIQIAVTCTLTPQTRDLTAGALFACLETFRECVPWIGGQSARGHGKVRVECLVGEEELGWWRARQAEYEEYLEENRMELREGLERGTLGTGKVLLS